jgi:hypothetical protein
MWKNFPSRKTLHDKSAAQYATGQAWSGQKSADTRDALLLGLRAIEESAARLLRRGERQERDFVPEPTRRRPASLVRHLNERRRIAAGNGPGYPLIRDIEPGPGHVSGNAVAKRHFAAGCRLVRAGLEDRHDLSRHGPRPPAHVPILASRTAGRRPISIRAVDPYRDNATLSKDSFPCGFRPKLSTGPENAPRFRGELRRRLGA